MLLPQMPVPLMNTMAAETSSRITNTIEMPNSTAQALGAGKCGGIETISPVIR